MGPNGAGKSTLSAVVMGKPGYEVLGGSVTLDGVDLLALPAWERAAGRPAPGDAVPERGAGRDARPTCWTEALHRPRPLDRRSRRVARGRGRAHRLRRPSCCTVRSTSTCRAARRSATRRCSSPCWQPQDRDPRRARLRPRHRCAARLRPPGRGATNDEPTAAARRARHHALQPAARGAARPIMSTSW